METVTGREKNSEQWLQNRGKIPKKKTLEINIQVENDEKSLSELDLRIPIKL